MYMCSSRYRDESDYLFTRSPAQVKGYEYNNRSKSIREISFHSN